MFSGYRSVALRASFRRSSTPEAHTGILALFSIVITLIRLCHESRLSPLFVFPPINPLDLNYHPVRLAICLHFSYAFLILTPPASLPNSFALLVLTNSFASSQFQNECST
ncbi:hypothetical protein N7501_001564 [Penicillium viridicatum]|nr:hypothetical protein N7501_001564 [Penicillium viridicatum]